MGQVGYGGPAIGTGCISLLGEVWPSWEHRPPTSTDQGGVCAKNLPFASFPLDHLPKLAHVYVCTGWIWTHKSIHWTFLRKMILSHDQSLIERMPGPDILVTYI